MTKYIKTSNFTDTIVKIIHDMKSLKGLSGLKCLIVFPNKELSEVITKEIWSSSSSFIPIVNIKEEFATSAPVVFTYEQSDIQDFNIVIYVAAEPRIPEGYTGNVFVINNDEYKSNNSNTDRAISNSTTEKNSYRTDNNKTNAIYNNNNKKNVKNTYSDTFFIIKPAIIDKKQHIKLLDFIVQNGFILKYLVLKKYSKDIWLKLYQDLRDVYKDYDQMCENFSKAFVMFATVTTINEDATTKLKKLRGHHVDAEKCEPNTIRAIFGKGLSDSVIHVPDHINYEKEYVLLQNKAPYQRAPK